MVRLEDGELCLCDIEVVEEVLGTENQSVLEVCLVV